MGRILRFPWPAICTDRPHPPDKRRSTHRSDRSLSGLIIEATCVSPHAPEDGPPPFGRHGGATPPRVSACRAAAAHRVFPNAQRILAFSAPQNCIFILFKIRDSIVVSISACHAEDPGTIPGRGDFISGRSGAPETQLDGVLIKGGKKPLKAKKNPTPGTEGFFLAFKSRKPI